MPFVRDLYVEVIDPLSLSPSPPCPSHPCPHTLTTSSLELDQSKHNLVILAHLIEDTPHTSVTIQDPYLIAHFNLIWIDLPAHGRSTTRVHDPIRDQFVVAAQLAMLLSEIGAEQYHVYALSSLPFRVALNLMLMFPKQVHKLLSQ